MHHEPNCFCCSCRTACVLFPLKKNKQMCVKLCELKKHAIVYSAGLPADGVFIVQRGSLRITFTGVGGQSRIVRFVSSGDIFGLDSFLPERERVFTVVAREDSAVCFVRSSDFELFIKQNCEQMWRLFLLIDGQVHSTELEKMEITGQHVKARLRDAIARIGGFNGEYKQRELAAFLGVSEETVSRQLKRMREKGLAKINRRSA